jgi:hypothetical protein
MHDDLRMRPLESLKKRFLRLTVSALVSLEHLESDRFALRSDNRTEKNSAEKETPKNNVFHTLSVL